MDVTADLLMHPVRMRVLQALLGDRRLTTRELGAELADVPVATLYRHVGALVEAGVLEVVEERRARGAVERTYALRVEAAQLGPEALAAMTPDDHRAAFTAFVAGLLGAFDRYLAAGDPDLARDRAGYRQAALWLDDEEFDAFARELSGVVERAAARGPAAGRRRRLLSTIVLPA